MELDDTAPERKKVEADQAEAWKQLAALRRKMLSTPAFRSKGQDFAKELIRVLQTDRGVAIRFRERTDWHHIIEGYNELIDEARELLD